VLTKFLIQGLSKLSKSRGPTPCRRGPDCSLERAAAPRPGNLPILTIEHLAIRECGAAPQSTPAWLLRSPSHATSVGLRHGPVLATFTTHRRTADIVAIF